MTTTTRAFWVDDTYDRDQATDGITRYGAYVRQAEDAFLEAFDWHTDDPLWLRTEFATTAWRTATVPVMSPGYVRAHHRIAETRLFRSQTTAPW